MANPTHHSILLEHEKIVNGVLFKKRKDLIKTLNDEGLKESQLIHTRVIGEKSFTTKQCITDGEKEEEIIYTDMNHSEIENFKNEWEENGFTYMMPNPEHRSILPSNYHQMIPDGAMMQERKDMIVDGVFMQERKDLTKTRNDETGVMESKLIHSRVIGEKSYITKQSITDEEETDMDEEKLENFFNEWEEKWNPSILDDEPGIFTKIFEFFNRLI